MDELKENLKKQIIEQLNLEEMEVSDIANDAALFSADGVGLDSIDALELIVLLEKHYQISLTNPEEGKKAFYSIDTLSEFIRSRQLQ